MASLIFENWKDRVGASFRIDIRHHAIAPLQSEHMYTAIAELPHIFAFFGFR